MVVLVLLHLFQVHLQHTVAVAVAVWCAQVLVAVLAVLAVAVMVVHQVVMVRPEQQTLVAVVGVMAVL
jgi:hypothetical protein